MNQIVIDVSSDEADDECVAYTDKFDGIFKVPDEKTKSTDLLLEIKDDDDDDCVILDYDPTVKKIVVETCESDEVLVTGQKYEIACRDFPHPRHACAKHPFRSTLHHQHCENCYCYVCDTRAPCPYWFTGLSTDHCHANDKEETWQNQRECIRTGNTVEQFKRVSSPRPIPLPQNWSTTGIRACSNSATYTGPGYKTEQSRTFQQNPRSQPPAVPSVQNHRDAFYHLNSSPEAVPSNPYISSQRPSQGVSFGVQNIVQGSQATHYAPQVPSLTNAQQIGTGDFSTVPVYHSKESASQFNRNMNSGNLQTNEVPFMTPNPPVNQQQQPGRSKDKVLSEFEDWLLDDSTLVRFPNLLE